MYRNPAQSHAPPHHRPKANSSKGANAAEWFCLDTGRCADGGECPVLLFDPSANQIDQIFYADFGAMVREVLEFVDDTLRGDDSPRD